MNKDLIFGFITDVFNSYNLNIDIFFTTEQRKKYKNILSSEYTYEENNIKKTGTSYRARLTGIGINNNVKLEEINNINNKFLNVINSLNGFVLIKIIEVDSYRRLLVELYDINKKDLRYFHYSYSNIFYKYPKSRHYLN